MDKDQLDIRREKLQREIDHAKALLKGNFDQLQVSSYLVPEATVSPLKNTLLQNPTKALGVLDQLTRLTLSPSSMLRQLLKYINISIKGFQYLSK